MKNGQVYVRRERPTALAVAIALLVTMLAVYVLTLDAIGPDVVESVSAAPRVTREIEFAALEGWCVSLGRYDSADQARVEAAAFADQGAAGRVWASEGRYEILGAMADSRRQAERLAEALPGGISGGVVALRSDAVRMRITAPDRQIDLIVASDGLLRDAAWQLAAIAGQLDRGEIQPESALTLCALTATEARSLLKRLEGIPGADQNALCARLMENLDRLASGLGDMNAQGGPAALSGRIRLAGMDAFFDLMDMQDALTR